MKPSKKVKHNANGKPIEPKECLPKSSKTIYKEWLKRLENQQVPGALRSIQDIYVFEPLQKILDTLFGQVLLGVRAAEISHSGRENDGDGGDDLVANDRGSKEGARQHRRLGYSSTAVADTRHLGK